MVGSDIAELDSRQSIHSSITASILVQPKSLVLKANQIVHFVINRRIANILPIYSHGPTSIEL